MIVKATKSFISAAYGNVEPGKVFEADDARGKILIGAGLVVEYVNKSAITPAASSFPSPVQADPALSSLPEAQASPEKIVSASGSGEKKVTYRKREKSRS